ncbi:FACT complex subunit SSRP1 [Leucoagaricus sp. SymC.cos]|nr:FACT complex subunit SSRP1 [Leucoagaricus sp. SymC.cos]
MANQLTEQRDLVCPSSALVLVPHTPQYIDSIVSLAVNMRKCAELGESFVKVLKGASDDELRTMFNSNKRKAEGSLEDDEGPKKRKRNTKPKDPNAPKRPASSYILFQNEIRKELKEKFPNLTNPELLNKISEMWKNMSEEEKAQYHKAVESAKERYSQDKKAYDNRTPEEVAAANAAAAEAAAAKKSRPRKKKAAVADPAPAEVPARPPPAAAAETSQSASSSEEESTSEDSDDEDAPAEKESPAESDSSEDEPEPVIEEKPAKKSKKAAPESKGHKSKKGAK